MNAMYAPQHPFGGDVSVIYPAAKQRRAFGARLYGPPPPRLWTCGTPSRRSKRSAKSIGDGTPEEPQTHRDCKYPQLVSDTFVLVCAGGFLIVVLSLIVYGAWRAYTPRGFAFYFAMWGCMSITGVCAWHSTLPSSAPRRQAEGTIAWIASHGGGKSKSYTLGLRLPSGVVLPFRASPTPPFFAEGRRDVISVTYLDEKGRRQLSTGNRISCSDRTSCGLP